MPTLFTKIIKAEIPCEKILEDENYFAFLDIRPINPGHTLIIPKREVDYIFDLDDDVLSGLMVFAKKVAIPLRKAVPCERIGIMVAGLEVPHVHIHLVPMSGLGDLNFANGKAATPEALAEVGAKIRSQL